jgi:CBS-domain-containing membrane protein
MRSSPTGGVRSILVSKGFARVPGDFGMRESQEGKMSKDKWCSLAREDFEHALDEMGSVIDVSVNDLIQLTEKARRHAQMRRAESLLVKNLMSQPLHTIQAHVSLGEAAQVLLSERISGLPVVDTAGHLIGIITEADFLSAIGVPCHPPTHNFWQTLSGMFSQPLHLHEPNENVGALMVSEVVTAQPEQTLHEAVAAMKSHRVKRLVVVDEQHAPVGMLTRSDLVRVFFERIRDTGHGRGADQS